MADGWPGLLRFERTRNSARQTHLISSSKHRSAAFLIPLRNNGMVFLCVCGNRVVLDWVGDRSKQAGNGTQWRYDSGEVVTVLLFGARCIVPLSSGAQGFLSALARRKLWGLAHS